MERNVNVRITVEEDRLEELQEYLSYLNRDFGGVTAWVMPAWTSEDSGTAPIITWFFE